MPANTDTIVNLLCIAICCCFVLVSFVILHSRPSGIHTGFFAGGGGGGGDFVELQKTVYLCHDHETVKQISDENLTNYIIVRCCLRDHF